VLVLAIAACGRFGFERRAPPDGVGMGGDGPGATDAPGDGTVAPTVYYQISTVSNVATLFTVDIPTGQLTQVGTFAVSVVMGGLAYGDANTLYATGINVVYAITLSPFSAAQIQTFSGSLQTLEQDGTELVGVLDGTNKLARFTPGSGMSSITMSTAVTAAGGDLAHAEDGTWYWYTNTGNQLFTLDVTTGQATLVGTAGVGAPYAAGLLPDDSGRLFLTSGSTDQIVEISTANGSMIGSPYTLCVSCPTSYALGPGDSTRTP